MTTAADHHTVRLFLVGFRLWEVPGVHRQESTLMDVFGRRRTPLSSHMTARSRKGRIDLEEVKKNRFWSATISGDHKSWITQLSSFSRNVPNNLYRQFYWPLDLLKLTDCWRFLPSTKAYNSPSWIAVGLPRRAKVEISKTKLLEPRLHSPFPSTIRQPCMADLPGCFNCGLSYLEIEIKYRSKPKEKRLHRNRQNLPAIPTLWRTKAMIIVFLLIQYI